MGLLYIGVEMKWFKHYTDASEGRTLQNLYREFGLEGEARYWRLVQLLSKQYDGSTDKFYLSLETIRGILRLRSLNDCRLFLDHLANISEFKVEYSGNDCLIQYHKVTEIKDNHTKDLQAKSKRLAENLPLEQNRIEQNRIDTMSGKPDRPPLFEVEKPEIEEVKISDKASTALTMLNALCFKSFRPTKSHMKYINARLNEGFSLDDFKKVIVFKHRQWATDPEMRGFLRPQTIFGTKFDGYLQEALTIAPTPIKDFFANALKETEK